MKTSRYWLSGALLALGLLMALLMSAGWTVDAAPNVCATPIPKNWRIKGNCGTNPAKHFIGTSDNQPLVLRTDKVERMRLDANGNVGIGTTSPGSKLSVAGVVQSTNGGFKFPDNTVQTTAAANSADWTLTGNASTNPAANFIGTKDNQPLVFKTQNLERARILSNGSVGIGTSNPTQKLEVAGSVRLYPTSGNGTLFIRNRTDANYSQVVFNDDLGIYRAYLGYIGANAGMGSRDDTVELGTNGKELTFRPGENEAVRIGLDGGVSMLNGMTAQSDVRPAVSGTGSDTIGVYGLSLNFRGVFGQSSAASGTSGEAAGVYGLNHSCSAGQQCYGVYSDGNFVVAPGYTKSALVSTSSFGERKLYAMESPENWFEDFGFGQLVNGRAVIGIDPIFAQTVNLNEPYHVFLTPRDGFAELYVTNLTPTAFEVRDARGVANLAFDYRIIAKRLGMEHLRLTASESLPSSLSTPPFSQLK